MASTRRLAWRSITSVHRRLIATIFCLCLASLPACAAESEPTGNCLEITLTGTQGGPPAVNGLAGAGTLIRYGSVENDCSDTLLQFDAGRGTTERLSQVGVSPLQLDAIFLTHMHSDHTEGLAGLLQYRWHFLGDPVDIICSADVVTITAQSERTLSCRGLVAHTADALLYAGEIAQRRVENSKRDPGGPAALARLQPVSLPLPAIPGTVVWRSGDVSVTAIATVHIPGSLAYRVDTPVGSVVISGDAGNSKPGLPRETSTSETVEALADGADVLVQSAIHPVFAPGSGSDFPAVPYFRQSNAEDIGAMAERSGVAHLMLTHLIPAVDTAAHGPYQIPGGGISRGDFAAATRAGGYKGAVSVGQDLLTLRLPIAE